MKCKECEGTGVAKVVEFSYDWAMYQLWERKEVEATWGVTKQWQPVKLDQYGNGMSWCLLHGGPMGEGEGRKYRLKPTPPKAEVVEWEQCERSWAESRFFKNPASGARYKLLELAGLKSWQLINFTFSLPNLPDLKTRQDYIWWCEKTKTWSHRHPSNTNWHDDEVDVVLIRARCANMLAVEGEG